MRKFGLFLLLILLVNNIFAAPLIFKAKKDVTKNQEEIGILDTSKYKQIKVLVQFENKDKLEPVIPERKIEFKILFFLDTEETYFDGFSFTTREWFIKRTYFNKVIDLPPDKLKFEALSKGTYWIYVWGVQ